MCMETFSSAISCWHITTYTGHYTLICILVFSIRLIWRINVSVFVDISLCRINLVPLLNICILGILMALLLHSSGHSCKCFILLMYIYLKKNTVKSLPILNLVHRSPSMLSPIVLRPPPAFYDCKMLVRYPTAQGCILSRAFYWFCDVLFACMAYTSATSTCCTYRSHTGKKNPS